MLSTINIFIEDCEFLYEGILKYGKDVGFDFIPKKLIKSLSIFTMRDNEHIILESLYKKINESYIDDDDIDYDTPDNPYKVTVEDQVEIVIDGVSYFPVGDVLVNWTVDSGQKQTMTDPGFDPELEILNFEFSDDFKILRFDEDAQQEIHITPNNIDPTIYAKIIKIAIEKSKKYAEQETQKYFDTL